MPAPLNSKIGAVVIGRNEEANIRSCLESIRPHVSRIVYVDSGSTDSSVARATELGIETLQMDQTAVFTAARARNAGCQRLLELGDIEFVQFVDGDCVLFPDWIRRASAELTEHRDLAVVCGHVCETDPRRNVYHRLAAMEWDTPTGITQACGGIALMRVAALQQVGGFNETLLAGEEPELCVRLRAAGWQIKKIDADMVLHDIELSSFAPWWRRTIRSGHAYAEVAALHRTSPVRIWDRESRSILVWGLIVPLVAAALAWPTYGLSLAIAALLYALLFAKIAWHGWHSGGKSLGDSVLYAGMCVLSKWPQAIGLVKYWAKRTFGTSRVATGSRSPSPFGRGPG